MEEMLKLAIENGNTTAVCVLGVLIVAQWAGPPVWRKLVQGRNGSSTMRGQLDHLEEAVTRLDRRTERIERVTAETHDAVIKDGVRLDVAEKQIDAIFSRLNSQK